MDTWSWYLFKIQAANITSSHFIFDFAWMYILSKESFMKDSLILSLKLLALIVKYELGKCKPDFSTAYNERNQDSNF